MAHRNRGWYPKGVSGNPRGRPPDKPRPITGTQLRRDMLLAMEEEMTVSVGGKRKRLPIILAIYKQLLLKAVAGDLRCMLKAIDLRNQLMADHMNAKAELSDLLMENEKSWKDHQKTCLTKSSWHRSQRERDCSTIATSSDNKPGG
jgi:replication-associated recombination protein RarA